MAVVVCSPADMQQVTGEAAGGPGMAELGVLPRAMLPRSASLSILNKIQPWGNNKSARLRAALGLTGPQTATAFAIDTTAVAAAAADPLAATGARALGRSVASAKVSGCVQRTAPLTFRHERVLASPLEGRRPD